MSPPVTRSPSLFKLILHHINRRINTALYRIVLGCIGSPQGCITIYVGIDDTDSKSGMCTTFLLTEIIRELSDYDVIGYPHLVRLNPMIPWKTRGNGALSIRFGRGDGKSHLVGKIDGIDIRGYAREKKSVADIDDVQARIERLYKKYARFDDENTNPAYVISKRRLPLFLYSEAVRRIVELKNVIALLEKSGASFQGFKNGRGLIGAAAAISWRPRDKTYEIITYRQESLWGLRRNIEPLSVIEMEENYPETFNNFDYENKHVCIAPSSPCPVLFGIRAENPSRLFRAAGAIRSSETPERSFLFETNQATDDHLQRKQVSEIQAYDCVIVSGTVSTIPRAIIGGHTIFRLADTSGEIDCTAYEPSKRFRRVVRGLALGDEIMVYGGVRDVPRTINIEKLLVRKLAEVRMKTGNPLCGTCGTRMKSAGKDAGYRCLKCGARARIGDIETVTLNRDIKLGFYEPPASARRHLSKPLKRMEP